MFELQSVETEKKQEYLQPGPLDPSEIYQTLHTRILVHLHSSRKKRPSICGFYSYFPNYSIKKYPACLSAVQLGRQTAVRQTVDDRNETLTEAPRYQVSVTFKWCRVLGEVHGHMHEVHLRTQW